VAAEIVVGPVAHRDADDRTGQQPTLLQSVERVEGHDLGHIASDYKDDEHVRALLGRIDVDRSPRPRLRCYGHGGHLLA
jgi:hypothetical protein